MAFSRYKKKNNNLFAVRGNLIRNFSFDCRVNCHISICTYCFIKLVRMQTLLILLLCVMSRSPCCQICLNKNAYEFLNNDTNRYWPKMFQHIESRNSFSYRIASLCQDPSIKGFSKSLKKNLFFSFFFDRLPCANHANKRSVSNYKKENMHKIIYMQ